MNPSLTAGQVARPRIDPQVPVLDRGDASLQVGLEPGTIVTTPSAGDWAGALRQFDGRHTCAEVAAQTGLPAAGLSQLIDGLDRLGMTTGPDPDRRTGPRVRLIGAGAVGRAVARAWVDARAGELIVVDPEPPEAGLYQDSLPTAAESLAAQLRRSPDVDRDRIRVGPHWYSEAAPVHDLTVIAGDTVECDRVLTDTLLRQDRPHLLVRPRPAGMLVGPLVIPGHTSCTRCSDLVRLADHAWPQLLAQLTRFRVRPDAGLLGWAAQTAVQQILAWSHCGSAETLGATLELCRDSWTVAQRQWPQHPDCGCAGWD